MTQINNIENSWNKNISERTKITFDNYKDIADLYKSGLTLAEVGKKYGVTRERVRQILSRLNVEASDGGRAIKTFIGCQKKSLSNKQKINKKEADCFQKYGCNLDFKNELRGTGNYFQSAFFKYRQQKTNAISRGISFELTLPEWWDIWQKSGHWHERGLAKDKYVMARLCDLGSYSVDNVTIITQSENAKEARLMDKVLARENTWAFRGKKYLINDDYYTLKELSEIYGLKVNCIYARIQKGMDVLQACTKKPIYIGKHLKALEAA